MVAAVLILIELDDLENSGSQMRSASEEQQWISGRFHVGHGGLESTGRHSFGQVFKISAIKKHMFSTIFICFQQY